VTDLGVFDVTPDGFVCIEHAADVTLEEIQQKTAGKLRFADQVQVITFS
jgi:3-oxoacid CoA-transferase subunit B